MSRSRVREGAKDESQKDLRCQIYGVRVTSTAIIEDRHGFLGISTFGSIPGRDMNGGDKSGTTDIGVQLNSVDQGWSRFQKWGR